MRRTFNVQTDHRALVWLDRLKDSNSQLSRWSLSLQQYHFTVTHHPGVNYGNADALSRCSQTSLRRGERYDRLATADTYILLTLVIYSLLLLGKHVYYSCPVISVKLIIVTCTTSFTGFRTLVYKYNAVLCKIS